MSYSDPDADLRQAAALIEMRRYPEAALSAQRVLGADPHNARAACLLAQSALGTTDYSQALAAAESAIAIQPDWEWPHRLASIACSALNMRERAVIEAQEAVRLAPDQYATHVRLGEALLIDGKLDTALEHSERALALAPGNADAHNLAGRVAHARGRNKEATQAYLRALEIQPDHVPSHNNLARLKLQGGRFRGGAMADAASGFATALRADPHNDPVRRNLELAFTAFLRQTAYLVFLGAWIGVLTDPTSASGHTSGVVHILPLVVLALPALYAARFLGRLTPPLRRFLLDAITHRVWLLVPSILVLVAAVCVLGEALTTSHLHSALGGVGAISAIAGRVLLLIYSRKQRKPR
jgi:tetratricopeptide (TPR) repeat protein